MQCQFFGSRFSDVLELEADKQLTADAVVVKPNKAKLLGLHWDTAKDNLAVTFFSDSNEAIK